MEVDNNKRMISPTLRVLEDGKGISQLAPAKFIYKKMPGLADDRSGDVPPGA